MLRNSNPFGGAPCTDAINSIKNPSSLTAQVLCLWKQSIQVTLFAGGKALPVITTWTKQGYPLKKGSIPACIFPSQTRHAGGNSEEPKMMVHLQGDKMLTVKLSTTSCFHIRQFFLWPAQFCFSQETEAVSIFQSLCFHHCARPTAPAYKLLHAMGCPFLTKIQGWATLLLLARDILNTLADFPGYFAIADWLPMWLPIWQRFATPNQAWRNSEKSIGYYLHFIHK